MTARIRRKYKKAMKPFARKKPRGLAILGNGAGVVKVPGEKNKHYATDPASGSVFVVHNLKTPARAGMYVEIGEDDLSPGITQVLGIHLYEEAEYGVGPNVGEHGANHLRGGSDPSYIDLKQIINLLAFPGTGLTVKIYGGYAINCSGSTLVHSLGGVVDLTSYIPSSGHRKYILISLNASGVLTVTDGTEVDSVDLAIIDAPDIPDTYAPICFVRLRYGQTTISDAYADPDIIDLRYTMRAIGTIHHHVTHEDGGSDEISVAALSGKLADLQNAGWIQDFAVSTTDPADNQVLTYDSGSSKYVPETVDHDAQKIKGVPVTAPNAGNDQQALIYDNASVTFKYGASGGGSGGGDLYWYVDGALAPATGLDKRFVAPYAMTITNVIINVKTTGSANTTTIDININGVSIFAVPPTIAWDDAGGIVEILATTVDIAEGDVITMDIDAVATDAADLTVCVVVSNASVVDTVPSLRVIMRNNFR